MTQAAPWGGSGMARQVDYPRTEKGQHPKFPCPWLPPHPSLQVADIPLLHFPSEAALSSRRSWPISPHPPSLCLAAPHLTPLLLLLPLP